MVGVSGLSTKEGGACEVDGTLEVGLRNQAMIKNQNGKPFNPTWVTTLGLQGSGTNMRLPCYISKTRL